MGVGLTAWRVVSASVEGSRHRVDDQPCQDAHAIRIVDDGTVVLAVADGAGSADRAERGARLAVDGAADAVADALAEVRPEAPSDWSQLVAGSLVAARAALDTEADHRVDARAALATTLTVAVVHDEMVDFASVGDGAVVVTDGESIRTGTVADAGEYLNETTFLTGRRWADAAQVGRVEGPVRGVALLTDGLQLLALEFPSYRAHAPFFAPLFAFARSRSATGDELAAFLASDRVCGRTDDDKTLVLAVRD